MSADVILLNHRWSGWPGAWCLDCGREDPTEWCAIEHDYETCTLPECDPGKCPTPNSHNYDPYYKKMKKKIALEWTGNPTCWICGNEYEPYTGDGDGACYFCYNGVSRDD